MKRHATSYIIRETQIKMEIYITKHVLEWPNPENWHHQILASMYSNRNSHSFLRMKMGGNAKCYSHFGRQFSDFLQNLVTLSMQSISHALWCLFKEVKTYGKHKVPNFIFQWYEKVSVPLRKKTIFWDKKIHILSPMVHL